MELRNSSVGELLLITGFLFPCNWNNVHLGMFPLPNHHLQWHHTTIYPNSYPWFSPDYPMKNNNVCYLHPDFLWLNPYSFLEEICNCSSNNSRQSMLRMQPVRDSINPEAEECGCGCHKDSMDWWSKGLWETNWIAYHLHWRNVFDFEFGKTGLNVLDNFSLEKKNINQFWYRWPRKKGTN